MDEEVIFRAEGGPDQEILGGYLKEPPRRNKADPKEVVDDFNGSTERLSKIYFECTLVGNCFLHGVIYGEAMELIHSGWVEAITFGIW